MIIKDFIAIVDKSTSMNENDVIHVINRISSILYEPIGISNTDKNIGDRDSARSKGRHIMYIWFIIKR